MITTVLFDMGGTLEDIWVDGDSESRAIHEVNRMLTAFGLPTGLDDGALKRIVDAGWARYGRYRDATDVELKPIDIWCDYVLSAFGFERDALTPKCEALAHMWEVTHFHRRLRPGVAEMLAELQSMSMKLGVISNTAALYQVFDTLEEYGIRDFFQDVTLSSVTGLRKPCRDIFTVSLRQMRSRPEESVYVGDTISRDVTGAKRAGFAAAIQITSQLTVEKDAHVRNGFEPDVRVADITEVPNAVRGLMAGR